MPRAQREQLILDVAGRVFARDGYHDASMDEISRLAGVSKPMLYAYFSSKAGLYMAYIERTGQELVDRLQRTISGNTTSLEALRARVDGFLLFVDEHRDGWRVLLHEVSSNRPVAEQVAELRQRITAAVRRLVVAGVAGWGEIEPDAAEGLAHAIVGAGESLANWWLETPVVDREQVAEWYVDVIRGAVAAVTTIQP